MALFRTPNPSLIKFKPTFKPLKRPETNREGDGFGFSHRRTNQRRKRCEVAVREGAGGSWTAVARLFRGSRGVSKRERAFVRGTSCERELGVQGLRVRSPLVNFFFHSEVCMPRGGEPFCG